MTKQTSNTGAPSEKSQGPQKVKASEQRLLESPVEPMDYHLHFGFDQAPFELETDPALFVLSQKHEEALDKIYRGVLARKGFVVLTGEPGTGKTLLLHTIMSLTDSRFVTAYIFHPDVEPEGLLDHILNGFGIPLGKGGKAKKLRRFYDFIIACQQKGLRPLVVIDDAQKLSIEALEEIRMISNLQNPDGKLIQFLLAGQPELVTLLNGPDLRQLKQRIASRFELRGLNLTETYRYIAERCVLAGARRVVFDSAIVIRIYSLTSGLPRLINIVCDLLLLQAFLRGSPDIDVNDVRNVSLDLDLTYLPIVPRPSSSTATSSQATENASTVS